MTKKGLPILLSITLLLTAFSSGIFAADGSSRYEFLSLQDFESENAAAETGIWGGGMDILRTSETEHVHTGSRSLKLQMSASPAGNFPVNNIYPRRETNNWTGYEGISFWLKTGDCPVVQGGGMVGRFESYFETGGARYTTVGGDAFLLPDGSTQPVKATVVGDNRYMIPEGFVGRIFIPFSSYAGWSESLDLSNIADFCIGFVVQDYDGNVYYIDSLALYREKEEDPTSSEPASSEPASSEPASSEPASSEPASSEPASSEPASSEPASSEPASSEPASSEPGNPGTANPLLIQDFEAEDVNACASRWPDGAGAVLSLSKNGVNGSSSLKIEIGAPNGAQPSMVLFVYPLNRNLSAGKTLMFYAENLSSDAVAVGMNLQETGGERWYVGESKKIYLFNTVTGESTETMNGADSRMVMPKDFKGWVIVPQTSLKVAMGTLVDGEMDLSALDVLLIDADTSSAQGKVLCLDEIGMSEKSATQVLAELAGDPNRGGNPGSSDPLMVQDFEAEDVGACASRWADGAFAEPALAPGKGVNGSAALKIDFGAPNGTQAAVGIFISPLHTDYSAGKTLMFYAHNPGDEVVAVGLGIWEAGGERWMIGENKKLWLVDRNTGKSEEVLNGADARVGIPAGFQGWVLVPLTSLKVEMGTVIDGELDLSQIDNCMLNADASVMNGKTLYLDEFKFSAKTAAQVLDELGNESGDDRGNDDEDESRDGESSDREDDGVGRLGETDRTGFAVLMLVSLLAIGCVVVTRSRQTVR